VHLDDPIIYLAIPGCENIRRAAGHIEKPVFDETMKGGVVFVKALSAKCRLSIKTDWFGRPADAAKARKQQMIGLWART
jgi:hypothetical protein